jgi:hypothetical protein
MFSINFWESKNAFHTAIIIVSRRILAFALRRVTACFF